ncbi:MAG: cytochrome C [Gammaproteobacteria bacterium]|nr:cytochrome C [Gammaproteobacteria bacterium]
MNLKVIVAGIGILILAAGGYVYYRIDSAGKDHTGVPLEAPKGEPVVQPAPADWTSEQKSRQQAKAAFIEKERVAFDWFARFPFSEVDGVPLIVLKLLPKVAPTIWEGGDSFLAEVGLFRDSRYDSRLLPTGVGFSGIGRDDPGSNIDYTSFTCAACHIGRVRMDDGSIRTIVGGIDTEFNINLFFVKLHETLEQIYGDVEDPQVRVELVTDAFIIALDEAVASSPNYFYEDFSWNGRDFDAAYEAQQVELFREDAQKYVGDFIAYTEGFVEAFTVYLDKTYDGFQSEMLAGLPGMADATGVSASHGYETFEASAETRILAKSVLPDSPGITDFMPIWEQDLRTAEWDPTKQQLINGGGQYNGNIPIPIYRNLAASLTMGLKDTDVRVAAFNAELLGGLPATPYPFDVDEALAKEGEALFERHCAACHQPNNGRVYDELGTSMGRAGVINTLLMLGARQEYTGICSPQTTVEMYGKKVTPCAEFDGVSLKNREHVVMRPLDDQRGYNATPLKGVWAMAPYLHNGSVPTIYHLLMPETRPDHFTKSRLDYDQEKLGYAWQPGSTGEGYSFDTTAFSALRHTGHDTDVTLDGTTYRLDWSEHPDEAMAVVEYMKTL